MNKFQLRNTIYAMLLVMLMMPEKTHAQNPILNYQTISCKLKNTANPANTNVYLVFNGGDGELMRLDWFSFSK